MALTPLDIVDYILENKLEASFMNSLTRHVGQYTIGEIVDKEFQRRDEAFYLVSKSYSLDLEITDEDIIIPLMNGLYVTPFLSRQKEMFQVHFLVHKYPVSMKAQFDEQILTEIIQYMILRTVKALRLDTTAKVDQYIKASQAQ